MAAGRRFVDAPTSNTAAIASCHRGGHTAFVQVDQPFRRDCPDALEELFATLAVYFRVPLDGVERLFFSRRPNCPNHSRTIDQLIFTPISWASRSRNSATVKSGCPSTRVAIRGDTSGVIWLLGPGLYATRAGGPLAIS